MTDIIFERLYEHNTVYIRELIKLAQKPNMQVCVYGAGFNGKMFAEKILSIFNIGIDYFCDSDESKVGKEILPGLYCKSKEYLRQNASTTVCIMMIGFVLSDSALHTLFQMGIKNIITYEDLLALDEVQKQFLPFMGEKKDIAVYTCISGGYDALREPESVSERCDYYAITDKEPKKGSSYNWINIEDVIPNDIKNMENDDGLKNIFKNRWCKLFPNEIFKNYRYSIYVDGNVVITGKIEECVDQLKKARLGVAGSNRTDNPYIEGIKGIFNFAENPDICMSQMRRYWLEGLPKNAGSYLCSVLVREHMNPVCVSLMSQWWNEFLQYAKRDQFGLPYVLWKNGFTKEDVLLICDEAKSNAWGENLYWRYEYGHSKEKRNQVLMKNYMKFN